jgi:hypothetical protein
MSDWKCPKYRFSAKRHHPETLKIPIWRRLRQSESAEFQSSFIFYLLGRLHIYETLAFEKQDSYIAEHPYSTLGQSRKWVSVNCFLLGVAEKSQQQ